MEDSVFQKNLNDLPRELPRALAISWLMYGVSEEEARQECYEFPAATVDSWISVLRAKGWFGSQEDVERLMGLPSGRNDMDGAMLLWKDLLKELDDDESDFKHRVGVLDSVIKQGRNQDLKWLSSCESGEVIPFQEIDDHYPWQGCKFVATTVMLLVSQVDIKSKLDAIRPMSHSLGGLRLPSEHEVKKIRDPYIMSKTVAEAQKKANEHDICTALNVQVTDVEVMRNPGSIFTGQRPGTFAHSFVMTISKAGSFIFQGYGPLGYTLLQHMKSHSDKYPLDENATKEWLDKFEVFAAERGGMWTKDINEAYKYCFGVDLIKLGCMNVGSQLDVFVRIESCTFDSNTVDQNFDLLPRHRSSGSKVPCLDGHKAKAKRPPARFTPDGGIKHYYIPEILRCGLCHKIQEDQPHKRCAKCKAIHYCCREHQVDDWSNHKRICNDIAKRAKKKN
jgi:hypothetical protein